MACHNRGISSNTAILRILKKNGQTEEKPKDENLHMNRTTDISTKKTDMEGVRKCDADEGTDKDS